MAVMTGLYKDTIEAKKQIDRYIGCGWAIAAMVADKYGILVVYQSGK